MPQGSEVPDGWVSLTIQDVCDINPPKPKKGDLPGDTPVTFVPMPAVDAERGEISSPEIRPFSEVRSGFTAFKKGDVIMAKITPCMENGKAAVAKELVNDRGFGSTEFFVLRSNGSISPRYLFHYIRQRSFRSLAESNMTGSVGQKRVPKVFIQSAVIPLPPLPEQHRIVAAIEALFTRLDTAKARLERVPGILKQFRQAVLAAACDGRLTEDWRAENPDVEPAKDLINAIKNEVIGKKIPQKKSLSFKLKDKPFDIPKSWEWTPISGLCISITDGNHQAPEKSDEGIPFVVISNISSGKLNLSKTMYVPVDYYNNITDNRKPKQNDILFSVTGSYGIPILIKEDKEFCFQRHIALIRVHSKISANYIYYVLKSQLVYNQATKVATGIAQLTVPLSGLRTIKIPTPPLPEQHEIVRRVDALFALADKIEARVAAARKKTETMQQSILAQAFSGRLVPTEAELARLERRDYEPASVLLERIRSEKTKKKGEKRVQSTLT